MHYLTREILVKAASTMLEALKSNNGQVRDMTYYVHCAYGEEMGYGSTDMLSLSVRAELEKLGFKW